MHSLVKTLLNKHTQPRQGHADGGSLSERLCLCAVALLVISYMIGHSTNITTRAHCVIRVAGFCSAHVQASMLWIFAKQQIFRLLVLISELKKLCKSCLGVTVCVRPLDILSS